MWDDDTGYELSDPKHPTYYERYADAADVARKRAKEEPPTPIQHIPLDDECPCGLCQ